MKWVLGFAVLLAGVSSAPLQASELLGEWRLERINRNLHGQVVDYTDHHGADRRIWSEALCSKRNLYVYLPPGYDPCRRYPLLLWLHGYAESERLVASRIIPLFDEAIHCGRLQPAIIVAPSGSIPGKLIGSMFLNTCFGRYEDYVMHDVLPFVEAHYPICPDRRAHVIMGLSSGGWAAYNLAMRHRHYFGVVAGILPMLNPRWLDCHCKYRRNFDPCCWGWRTELVRPRELVGLWYGIPITMWQMVGQYFGWGDCGLAKLSLENPIENLDRHDIQPGELAMYVAYNRRDQLNADAQIESFLCHARQRGLCVRVDYNPVGGNHNVSSGLRFMNSTIAWIDCQLNNADCEVQMDGVEIHNLEVEEAK